MQNNNSKLNTVLLIIVITLLGIGIYFLVNKQDDQNIAVDQNPPVQQTETQPQFSFVPLTTKYIHIQQPLEVKTLTENYSCTVGGGTGDVPLVTTERTIAGRVYCVQTQSEGAAGSTYTTYVYTTGKTQVTFIVRSPECMNYDGTAVEECQTEKDNFSADQIIINASL